MGHAGAVGVSDQGPAGAGAGGTIADAGAGGAASGAGGEGISGAGNTGPHWLTFDHYQGVFAYDVSRYPDSAGLATLSAKPGPGVFSVGPWSPDGRWFLYQDAADLICRDMTQAVPGAPLLIGSAIADRDGSAASVARLSWSADSKSVALATSTNLVTFDPSHENPTLNIVTTSIRAAGWAPVGNRLFYRDNLGFHVVSVAAGQPGTSEPLDLTVFKTWSPDGKFIAAISGVDLVLIDVTGAAPAAVKVTSPTVALPYVSNVLFSPNGKALAFTGAQTRATPDLFYVPLDPLSAPQPITGSPADSTGASSFAFWSPDGRWLGFNSTGANSQRRAVDVANGVLSVPFTLKVQSNSPFSWLTETPNTFVAWASAPDVTFVTYDLSTPNADPIGVLLSASTLHELSPVGDILAADDGDAVAIRDLHAPPPPADVRVYLASSTNQLRWSPDGRFLSIIAEDRGYLPEVIHMAGSTPSKPLPIGNSSPANIISLWQPVFR
jgi:Tol biopolymer transport system component